MEVKQNLRFLVCPNCGFSGELQDQRCAACHGIGVVAPFYENRYLYWGKKIDNLNLAIDKAIRVVDLTVNILLGMVGLFGFCWIFYWGYIYGFETLFDLKYWLTPSIEKAVFWFTILVDLYLFYRLKKQFAPDKQVFPKIFIKKPSVPIITEWSVIVNLPKSQFIDISQAFDYEALDLINSAWSLAKEFNHPQVKRLHLLAVLPQFNQGAIICGRLGINLEKFREKIGKILNWNLTAKSDRTELAPEIYKLLIDAYYEAYNKNRKKVTVAEIIYSLVNTKIYDKSEISPDFVEQVLIDLDLNYQKIFNTVAWFRLQRELRENLSRFRDRARYRPKSGLDRAMTAVTTPFLDQYSDDLTRLAQLGKLFPCIGRDKEFEEIFRILEGSKNGVLLVGNYGVGRSALIHGLAQKMVEGTVPEKLQEKRLVSISVARLISGADAATAEGRLLTMAAEISRARNIVVVVEDLSGLVGITAGKEGSVDLADVFAELLSQCNFIALATATPKEYSKIIEGTSLDSVFTVVRIEEMQINDVIQVLEVKSGPIEYKNNVFFSYDSIDKAANLSKRFIHDRYLPDKALDIMEQAAAMVAHERGARAIVTGEDIARVISEKTGILVTKITEKESEKLLHLEEEMHRRVIGQEEAVKMVAASLRRARAEIRDIKRPIANLLFLGPTGVGKTELAKTVAEVYFGHEENMLRFDMSEYQNSESLNRLIGVKDEGGVLTEAVRKKPFSLLLFDEIEKSHPDILNVFLQVMDDGRLTDATGRTIDFTNTIIIMTSNVGAQAIQDEILNNTSVERIKERLLNQELRQFFKPEFLNRFDGIVVFTPLTMEQVIKIAHLLVGKVIKRLAEKNINLQVTPEAVAELAELGFDPKFGARPLRRVIQERLDDVLANALLKGEIGKRDTVIVKPQGELQIIKAE